MTSRLKEKLKALLRSFFLCASIGESGSSFLYCRSVILLATASFSARLFGRGGFPFVEGNFLLLFAVLRLFWWLWLEELWMANIFFPIICAHVVVRWREGRRIWLRRTCRMGSWRCPPSGLGFDDLGGREKIYCFNGNNVAHQTSNRMTNHFRLNSLLA